VDEEVASYRESLLAEIEADAVAGGDYRATRFIERACQVLENAEEITEYNICRGQGISSRRGHVQIDAFSLSPSDGILNLIVCDFSGREEVAPLMTEDVKRLINGCHRFLEGSVHDSISEQWDEADPVYALAREIFTIASSGEMTKACIYLITDRPVSASLGKMPDLALGTKEVEIHLWDIARMARVEASARGREEIVIDFLAEYGEGIPALPAGLGEDTSYNAFMCVVPGKVLADLYDRYGGRILEQNVRAFLGDTRKVNKGIRETLRNDPHMFFAFNNGLTTTVADVHTNMHAEGHTEIIKVKGLQIVNGGQTTASLYWARKAGIDLSRVRVQMKLSRVPEEGFEDAVHDIARFANAQNAVSASDLFAGHPYFKRLEVISRQTLAPPSKLGEVPSYWYFERTSGSYKVEIKRRAGVPARTWQVLNPKKQLITKTDAARFDATFDGVPHIVSQGAQKNIAAFGKSITQAWSVDPTTFDLAYFQRLVSRAIVTRAVDAAIPGQRWYQGSIVRPLSSYTLALMNSRMRAVKAQPNYDAIWRAQAAPEPFMREAMRVAELVLPLLTEIPEELVRNRLITEWVKREACWTRVEASDIRLTADFLATTVPLPPGGRAQLPWKENAKLLWRDGAWKRLRDWNKVEDKLTEGEAELVEWAAVAAGFSPNRFKLEKLEEAMRRAVGEGFV